MGIRTVLIDRQQGVARYGTGAGVTYQSTPHGEVAEAMLKTAVLGASRVDAALLETLYWSPAEGFRSLDRHLDRLARGIAYFDVPVSAERVRSHLNAAVQGADRSLRVRLVVARDGGIDVATQPSSPPSDRPVRLAIDHVPVDRNDPAMFFKTTDRRVYEAAADRHPGAEDVILVNDRAEVTETTIANIAVLLDGRWRTPPVDSGCLPGTRRAAFLAANLLDEDVVTVADLHRADGIVRFNALRDWEACELAITDCGRVVAPTLANDSEILVSDSTF